MQKKFLLGVLVGCLLTYGVMSTINAYDALNKRVSYIEGYLGQLDKMLRGASTNVVGSSARRAA